MLLPVHFSHHRPWCHITEREAELKCSATGRPRDRLRIQFSQAKKKIANENRLYCYDSSSYKDFSSRGSGQGNKFKGKQTSTLLVGKYFLQKMIPRYNASLPDQCINVSNLIVRGCNNNSHILPIGNTKTYPIMYSPLTMQYAKSLK